MITSGKKTALINRVIDYFEDPEAAILKFNPAKRKETRDSKKIRKIRTRKKNLKKMTNILLKIWTLKIKKNLIRTTNPNLKIKAKMIRIVMMGKNYNQEKIVDL